MSEKNMYVEMSKINVSEHIEQKGKCSYLSWTWAVDQLMRLDPQANWEFHSPELFGETMMVSCTVTAFGKSIRMHLPVMDHRNLAIKNPDAFAVNKNMMRCLVKAIACHGLGLYIFAGEDLPVDDTPKPSVEDQISKAENISQLKKIWSALSTEQQEAHKKQFGERKAELTPKEAA